MHAVICIAISALNAVEVVANLTDNINYATKQTKWDPCWELVRGEMPSVMPGLTQVPLLHRATPYRDEGTWTRVQKDGTYGNAACSPMDSRMGFNPVTRAKELQFLSNLRIFKFERKHVTSFYLCRLLSYLSEFYLCT